MSRKNPVRVTLEHLEDRCTPATFGNPWQDASHLTISFAPDGTVVDGVGSSLYQKMQSNGLSPAAWQNEILRAFQAWAAQTNINITVVPDGGAPIGASGLAQGDPRFGDIRIFAKDLGSSVLAITTPSGQGLGTRDGDIIVNTRRTFGVGNGNYYDLFTTALQESGHALGVGNSPSTDSAMYEYYQGVRTGLSNGDKSSVQALYRGAREADVFESSGNNSLDDAQRITLPTNVPSRSTIVVDGDLTSASDVDYYSVKSRDSRYGLTFKLQTGDRSLLAARMSVYDRHGDLIAATQTSTGPGKDLSITIADVKNGTTYYVKVRGDANTPYNVGAYRLKVISDPSAPEIGAKLLSVVDDSYRNETLAAATLLQTSNGFDANTRYDVTARLRASDDVDYYKFHSPTFATGQTPVLNIKVGDRGGVAPPRLTLYNAAGQVINAAVLKNADGEYFIQVANPVSNADYYVAVADSADFTAPGDYDLAVDFTTPTNVKVAFEIQDTLTPAAPQTWRTMTLSSADVRFFSLTAQGDSSDSAVRMTIYDARGGVVATLFAQSGTTAVMSVALPGGTYYVRFLGGTRNDAAWSSISYTLQSTSVGDPLDVVPINPTLPPPLVPPTRPGRRRPCGRAPP